MEQLGKRADGSDQRINQFALAAGLDLPVDESEVPTDPVQHYQAIQNAFQAERWSETRALAQVFFKVLSFYRPASLAIA